MERPVALVTGASSGIGAAFVRALAGRGHDIVLVSRTESRLRALADEIARDHGVSTEVLPADLETDDGTQTVESRLRDTARQIDLLVNNAGFGTSGRFLELALDNEEAEIRLNVLALVRLTHAALGPMAARGRGGVINVSSVGAYQPTPMSATYAATKAFVSSFSNAVHEELAGTGVKMMVLAPGFTHTEFHVRMEADNSSNMPEFLWQSAEEVVELALRDYEHGNAVCIPGVLNKAAAAFSSVMPAALTRKVASLVTKRAY